MSTQQRSNDDQQGTDEEPGNARLFGKKAGKHIYTSYYQNVFYNYAPDDYNPYGYIYGFESEFGYGAPPAYQPYDYAPASYAPPAYGNCSITFIFITINSNCDLLFEFIIDYGVPLPPKNAFKLKPFKPFKRKYICTLKCII